MEQLKLGVSRKIITPPLGCSLAGYGPGIYAESVADDLTATAFLFSQGETQALMISITLCNINTHICNLIQDAIEKETGIPRGMCMISCTHTHSGPNTTGWNSVGDWGAANRPFVEEILIPRVIEAIEEAKTESRPVSVGIASGDSYIGINRRQQTIDNKIILGQSPWGCVDTKMTVISFRDADGKTYANMVHYGLHGTCAGHHTAISRDWSGIMIDRMEMLTGGITAFFNGTGGDVGPRLSNGYTTGKGNYQFVYEIGNIAAQDAVRIWRSIPSYKDVRLQTVDCTVAIPFKPRMSLEAAREAIKNPDKLYESLTRSSARHYQNVIDSYENGYVEVDAHRIREVIIRIGDVAFYGLPFEIFSVIGLRIRAYSKIPMTLCVGYTNGSESYFAPQDQIAIGGYETALASYRHIQQYVENADWHLIKDTVENLKNVSESTDA